MTLEVGQRVRVKESVVIYVHPEHRNQAFDAQGSEGEVIKVLNDWQGRPISPNLPIIVQFRVGEKKKFSAHFQAYELEVLS